MKDKCTHLWVGFRIIISITVFTEMVCNTKLCYFYSAEYNPVPINIPRLRWNCLNQRWDYPSNWTACRPGQRVKIKERFFKKNEPDRCIFRVNVRKHRRTSIFTEKIRRGKYAWEGSPYISRRTTRARATARWAQHTTQYYRARSSAERR